MCDDNGILDANICRAFGTYAGKTCGAGTFFGFGQNYSASKNLSSHAYAHVFSANFA